MSPRKLAAAFAVAALALTTSPSFADDAEKGIKVDAEIAGSITGSSLFNAVPEDGSDGPSTGYSVTGHCTFAGALTPNNRLNITYGGFVTATGPQVPQLTYVKCDISNQDGQAAYAEVANGGAASTVASSVAAWRVSPVIVCVTGFAVYGPTPVTIVDLARTCDSIVA